MNLQAIIIANSFGLALLVSLLISNILTKQRRRYEDKLFLALIYIPLKWKNHFYCSQFVTSLLYEAGVVDATQPAATTLPNDLNAMLVTLTGAEKEPPSGAKDIVMTAVKSVFQTYVESLKEADAFSPEAQQVALNKARAIVASELTTELKDFIKDNYGDLANWLTNAIEASIYKLKN